MKLYFQQFLISRLSIFLLLNLLTLSFFACAHHPQVKTDSNSPSLETPTSPESSQILSQEPNSRANLSTPDQTFELVRQAFRIQNVDSLMAVLNHTTLNWLEEITQAVASADSVNLANRPFFEIITILSLRNHWRKSGTDRRTIKEALQELVKNPFIQQSFNDYPLGPVKINGLNATYGLEKAPSVPVFFLVQESTFWKINLIPTLPLILKGVESRFSTKHPQPLNRAFAVLKFLAPGLNRTEILTLR